MNNIQKIKNYIQGNKQILKWSVGSFLIVFFVAFFSYVGNDAKSGIYPEQEFGTLKELKERLNPYINIYNIKEQKSNDSEYLNKIEQVGFGFISTDNNNQRGSIVVKVYSGSPSEKAGLQVGDIIVTADGTEVLMDRQLGDLIDSKDKVNLKIKRGEGLLNISISKGSFIGEEGFRVGSSQRFPKSKNIPDEKVLDQANYGLDKLKNGMMEYSVEGISLVGALLIALLWAVTILPVLVLGTLFYKSLLKINNKFFIILINLIFVSVVMSGIMFLLSRNLFFDQMVRESANMGGGFIDLSSLIYPMFAVISSLFLVTGYIITLFIYKKNISK